MGVRRGARFGEKVWSAANGTRSLSLSSRPPRIMQYKNCWGSGLFQCRNRARLMNAGRPHRAHNAFSVEQLCDCANVFCHLKTAGDAARSCRTRQRPAMFNLTGCGWLSAISNLVLRYQKPLFRVTDLKTGSCWCSRQTETKVVSNPNKFCYK